MWEALPASYQKDVHGLLTEFSAKMDPQIWDNGFATAQKLVRVLEEKKEYLLKGPWLDNMPVDKTAVQQELGRPGQGRFDPGE